MNRAGESLTCFMCGDPLDRRTMEFDADCHLICPECYLQSATDAEIALALRCLKLETEREARHNAAVADQALIALRAINARLADELIGSMRCAAVIGRSIGAALRALTAWVSRRLP